MVEDSFGYGGGEAYLSASASPPVGTVGTYPFYVNVCVQFVDPFEEINCQDIGPAVLTVVAATQPQCVPSVGIVAHGSTANIAATRQGVAAGQLVSLDSSILNSCNQAAVGYSWSIIGVVSDWQADRNSAGPPSTPSLSSQSVAFAWTDGIQGRTVNLSVTFADGSTAVAQAIFDVSIPTAYASMRASNVHVDQRSQTDPGKWGLYFEFTYQYGNPSGPSGDYQWVQVVNNVVVKRHNISTNGWETLTLSGLDTTYPQYPINTALGGDQPISVLGAAYDQYIRNDDFTTSLMFKPSASPLGSTTRSDIWVPINAYNWTWSGAAQSSGGGTTWTLVPGSDSSDPAASLMNAPMPVWTSYLTWTANAADQLNNWIK